MMMYAWVLEGYQIHFYSFYLTTEQGETCPFRSFLDTTRGLGRLSSSPQLS